MTPPRAAPTAAAPPGVPDVLVRIAERRRERLAEARRRGETPREPPPAAGLLSPAENAFLGALARDRGRAVIAEVKLGSPRLGSLVERVDPLALARAYAAAGATALSVVVEPDFFGGSYEVLAACHEVSGLPAIAKDFVVDPLQLDWARRAGASAVLLVAALHDAAELAALARRARRLGLVPLVETHDLGDVMKLGAEPWELVGVNARDLRTFDVSLETAMALLPMLPAVAIKVAESGIASGADLARLRGAGFDAFLVGEALITAADPAAKLRELLAAASR